MLSSSFMASPAVRRATYEDVLSAPPSVVAEVIHGVLRTHPRPASPHARAASKLGGRLDGPFDSGIGGPGGWVILDEPELHLGADIVVPDLAGWRRERMPEMPAVAFFELAPDWVCEVLSPSTEAIDRAEKLPIYAREKGEHVWLLDPIVKTLEIFRLDGGAFRLVGTFSSDAVVRAEPFDAIDLALSALWAR
jgi:Uma2 family endonuclease